MNAVLEGLSVAACVYGVLAVGLGVCQRRLIFSRPGRVKRAAPGPATGSYVVKSKSFKTTGGLSLELAKSEFSQGEPKGTIIYFGGRRENVSWASDISSYAEGWNVVAANYRGFGKSEGIASEMAIKQDALKVFDSVRERGGRVVVVGRSLGTGVALHVAAQRAFDGLVLVSPMDSLRNVLGEKVLTWPFAWLLKDKFECVELAKRVQHRTLVVLSAQDRQVSMASSVRLCGHLRGELTLKIVDGVNHCNVHRAAATLRGLAEFLPKTDGGQQGQVAPMCRPLAPLEGRLKLQVR